MIWERRFPADTAHLVSHLPYHWQGVAADLFDCRPDHTGVQHPTSLNYT